MKQELSALLNVSRTTLRGYKSAGLQDIVEIKEVKELL